MSKRLVKFLFFVAALVVLIPAGFLAFRVMSSFIAQFNSGADPASIFHGHSLIIPQPEQARWVTTTPAGKQPTQAELEELIAAYWEAWEALARAHATNDPGDLPTYWGGAALEQAQRAVAPSPDATVFSHGGHQLTLNFWSADSSIASLRDENFTYAFSVGEQQTTWNAIADVVLTQDNGFWRIRQFSLQLH